MVDKRARVNWFCFPRIDGDPVFNSLLNGEDPQAGFMDVIVRGATEYRQSYIKNTAVLETVITDKSGGRTRVLDFAPRFSRFGRTFRPPMIIRRIEPIAGRPRITVRVRPRFDYGATQPTHTFGSNHLRYVSPHTVLRLTSDMPISYVRDEGEFLLDRPVNVFFGMDETLSEGPDTIAQQFLSETLSYWWGWVRGLAVPFEWQEPVIRSAITLKLCSYEDTGGIVAALTTSIPEAAHTTRNWDYRFCWLRDSFFTVNALNRLGATRTMEGFIRFVLDAVLREDYTSITPLYPLSPATPLEEVNAVALSGYRGMGPVRIGNAAANQQQNDSYGSIILTAAQMFWDERLATGGTVMLYEQLRGIGHLAERAALEPDAGPWEFRGRARIHSFSSTMCWAALHRLGMIAAKVGRRDEAEVWLSKAALLRADIIRRVTTPEGWLSGALDEPVVDASSLLLSEVGLLPFTDERVLKTIDIVSKRLVRHGLILRYDEADDFGMPETAFLVCTFWYVDALARAGRREEARNLFLNILSRRNHAGLLSEDVDATTGELWGNFPQTYSHVGLIQSAMRLSRSWEEGLWRAS
jgi:GH15 family glucan-1,4-alpha-glucosidase